MLRFLLGAFLVAVVSWIWSVLFYVVSPVPYFTVSETRDDLVAGAVLKEYFPETGTYILPGRNAGDEVRAQLRAEGPIATVYIRHEGSPEASPLKIFIGTFNGMVIGALIGLAMLLLNRYTTDYWAHVAIGTTFGMAYTAYPRFADIVWSDFHYGYQLMMIFSDGFSWILMVMVMAWFTRPRREVRAQMAST